MSYQYTCEYKNCLDPAVVEFTKEEHSEDGVETYTTYRCAKHAETAQGYKPKAISRAAQTTLDDVFGEVIREFAPALFDDTPALFESICPNCGESATANCNNGDCEAV